MLKIISVNENAFGEAHWETYSSSKGRLIGPKLIRTLLHKKTNCNFDLLSAPKRFLCTCSENDTDK